MLSLSRKKIFFIMSVTAVGQNMVKIRFEGKNLANCDFWTKSDPYLILSRPKRGGYDFTKVVMNL